MKSREFKKKYHPRMGRYVYQHRGNGIIIDTLKKPLKGLASAFVKPFAKKAIKAGVSHAGEKVGKMAADRGIKVVERSGELIRKRLSSQSKRGRARTAGAKAKAPLGQNEVNTLINNLIARS